MVVPVPAPRRQRGGKRRADDRAVLAAIAQDEKEGG
jgi:hypothetical protein